jgi:hypothetical protein
MLLIINIVFVVVPIMKAWISDGDIAPVAGQDYVLSCGITGAENLSPNITYQWTKDSGGYRTQIGNRSNPISFSPLKLSDAGQYMCCVIVQSPYIYNEVTTTAYKNVTLKRKSNILSCE